MDISTSITQDEMGYIVDAFIDGKKYHVTVMHPELQKAWDLLSSYVFRALEEGKSEE